jgi:D-glycero-D-manno-heptose 1,7-bisphosphate phosphatase
LAMRGKKVKTVFLDRDGVINRKPPDGDYVKSWEEFEFLPKAPEALRLLKEAGMRIIIITNQRGIARGLMTERDLEEIHKRMLAELARLQASVDAIYYCPHEEGVCDCRKPRVGLFRQAQQDFPDIDFSNSAVIGDSLKDMEAGTQLGSLTILIADETAKEKLLKEAFAKGIRIDVIVSSLFEAAELLITFTKTK